VPYSSTAFRKESSTTGGNFESVPAQLKFFIIGDMVYNNERNVSRLYIPFIITAIITPANQTILTFFSDLLSDPAGVLIKNWFWIFILIMLIMVGAMVYGRLKGNSQNININNRPRG
jgi:hypothetical protein